MTALDPRIRNALLSIHPTSKNPAWHGAPTALGLLRGVSAETAVWRPHASMNSIREIALHIAFWENSVANRLSGTSNKVPFSARTSGWPTRLDDIAKDKWRGEVRLLTNAHSRLVHAVERFDPAKLDDPPVGSRASRPAIAYIHGVAEHSLYHAAQIKMLKQLHATIA
jgi:hypothetical protein